MTLLKYPQVKGKADSVLREEGSASVGHGPNKVKNSKQTREKATAAATGIRCSQHERGKYCPIHKSSTHSLQECRANPERTVSEGESSSSGEKVAEQYAVMPHSASLSMQRKKRSSKQDEVNFIESPKKREVTEEVDRDDEYFAIEKPHFNTHSTKDRAISNPPM